MKNPCPLCNARKAQRLCLRSKNASICSVCCANIRNETCTGCSHYGAARQYESDRSQRITHKPLPEGHFLMAVNPAVEDAVDAALDVGLRGNIGAAWMQITQLLKEHPRNHTVCFGMGTLHIMKGERIEAVEWFDKATLIYPYFAEAHFNKALAYQQQLNIAGAVSAYRKAVEFGDPSEDYTKKAQSFLDDMAATIRRNEGVDLDSYIEAMQLFDQAFALMEKQDWAGALKGFRASAAKNDRNAPIHGNLGMCLASLGYKAQSLAELDRALAIDPAYDPAKINRVLVMDMEEGVPLNATGFKRIEFGKEQFLDATKGKP